MATKRKQDDTETKSASKAQLYLLIGIGISALFITGYTFWQYFAEFPGDLPNEGATWGQFGDFVGGVLNPILALAGLLALLYTIRLQIVELEQTRTEIRKTVDAAKQQTFESTFFQLLRLHNQNVEQITIEISVQGRRTMPHGRAALFNHLEMLMDRIHGLEVVHPQPTNRDTKNAIRKGVEIFMTEWGPDLGNYFVTVHELLDYISRCPDEDVDLTIFARMMRSQLASWEAMLIALYCVADQQLSPNLTKLVNDYSMLHFLTASDREMIERASVFKDTAFNYA